ncbi:aldo/keto reductase [Nesterenkonia ebinurensis]|uniref:aldo/keto reductase n=1 Tax=Nesterenkonia ebinurensis TaxID=2608252 RepID=UPI00123CC8A3|nr:aldo/keto reductase [Nesterenkonia ebinurensis]
MTTPRPGGISPFNGRTVSRIGFGAMQLPRLHEDRESAVRLVRRAIELGVDHIDTAQFYGHGFSNEVLCQALAEGDDVMVVSKVGWDPETEGPLPMRLAQRPEQLRASVKENLRTLGLEQIPVVNLRRIDVGPQVPIPEGQSVDLDDQLAEMAAMRDEGLIGGIGLSTVTADVVRQALPLGIACVQNAYSLVDRSDEDLLNLCVTEGIAWVPYFPLGSAFPGFPKVAEEPDVQSIADQLGASPAQVGLAWLLHHAANTLLIPGTASIDHLEANIATGDVHLDEEMTGRLDQIPVRTPEQH